MPAANNKIRADQLLVEQGVIPSRAKAQALIMAGVVFLESRRIEKPSEMLSKNATLRIERGLPFVSRGGIKLEHALNEFKIDVAGKISLDIGASTGGFTDCLLKHGAKKVYAVDVGYGQLDSSLRNDPRVISIERTNIKNLDPCLIKDLIDIITIDVSFISLTKVFPKVFELIDEQNGAWLRLLVPGSILLSPTLIALVKPQFEVGKGEVGKGGVVRDAEKQMETVEKIIRELGKYNVTDIRTTPSPIKGPKGNQEYLVVCNIAPTRKE